MCHSNKYLQKYESNQIQMCHSNKYLQVSDEIFIILELIQPNSARIWENKACPRLVVECQCPGSFQNAYKLLKIGGLNQDFSYFSCLSSLLYPFYLFSGPSGIFTPYFYPYLRQIVGILEAPRPLPLTKQPGTSFIFPDSGWIWLDKLQNHEFSSKVIYLFVNICLNDTFVIDLIHICVNMCLNDTFVIDLIHIFVNICLNDTFVIWGDLDSLMWLNLSVWGDLDNLIFVRLVGLGRLC